MKSYYDRGKVTILGNTTILGLGDIVRYNNRPKIKNENVAEHSFYVVATALKVCAMYNVDAETKMKALEFATVHDLGEIFLGDIPYDTKVNNPELSRILEISEVKALKQNLPEYAEAYEQFLKEEQEETVPYLIAKLADTTSVLQYSSRELELGNKTAQMKLINDDSYERVAKLIYKLEEKLSEEK